MFKDRLKKDFSNKKSAYITGAVLGVVTTLIMMIIFAAIILFCGIDRAYAAPFATTSVAFGCFLASRVTAKKIGEKGFVTGLIIGGAVFTIITIISLILGNRFSLNTLFHFIIILLASLVGGIAGVNTKQKKYI